MRALAAALLVANLAFWAWTQGWLSGVVGVSPSGDREPQRLQRQVDRERLRIVREGEVLAVARATAPVAPPAPQDAGVSAAANCLEAGPFTPAEAVAAEAALVRAALPPGSWSDVRIDKPGTWILYSGRFATREALGRREDELRKLGLAVEEVRNAPDLEFGLQLGRFEDRGTAETALAVVAQRGLRNVRVVAVAPPATTHLLRVERADSALAAQLTGLRVPALGAGFVRCGDGAAAGTASR